jgi:HAD superfamily, subfamily IIIB (Acid phosphatase)
MTRFAPPQRRGRFLPAAVTAAAATLGAALLLGPGSATAENAYKAVPAPPTVPTSADQIQNIDQVKTAIKGYYGDTLTSQVDPVSNSLDGGDKALHQFSATSNYAAEMAGIVAGAEKYLGKHKTSRVPGKAVLFDIDDTTLNTYSYEIYANFVYNPTTNAAFVNACLTATGCVFPAVPHMVGLEHYALSHGYAVFFLTGRPESQRAGTIANLVHEGYTVDPANVYLKDLASPILAFCTPNCPTTTYKSAYRAYIESLGFDIVANFGDQYSDLNGGFADRTFKIPNPMYFLP